MRSKLKLAKRQRRAAVAAELAITIPVVLTVFLGAIEITNLNFIRNTSNDVAFRVAREAIVPGADVNALESDGASFLASLGITGATVSSNQTPEGMLRVEVSVPVDQNSWGMLQFAAGDTVVQTCELSIQLGAS